MPPLVQFIIRRLLAIPVTLLIVTLVLYGIACLTSPDVRARIYMPATNRQMTAAQMERLIQNTIDEKGLDQPFPIQYANSAWNDFAGGLGMESDDADRDFTRAYLPHPCYGGTHALFADFVPAFGVVLGRHQLLYWQKDKPVDNNLRLSAFVSTSIPPSFWRSSSLVFSMWAWGGSRLIG